MRASTSATGASSSMTRIQCLGTSGECPRAGVGARADGATGAAGGPLPPDRATNPSGGAGAGIGPAVGIGVGISPGAYTGHGAVRPAPPTAPGGVGAGAGVGARSGVGAAAPAPTVAGMDTGHGPARPAP